MRECLCNKEEEEEERETKNVLKVSGFLGFVRHPES
jgi:hypothetical protein